MPPGLAVRPACRRRPIPTPRSRLTKLASATDASGGWGFTYSGANMGFVRPGESIPWLTNASSPGRMTRGSSPSSQHPSFADGSSYSYSFSSAPPISGHVAPIAGGSFTDNLGHTTTLEYAFPTQPYDPNQGHGNVSGETPGDTGSPIVQQITPGPVTVIDPLGRVTTTDYCEPTLMATLPPSWHARCLVMPVPASIVSPEGIRTEMTWDIPARHLLESRQIAAGGPLGIIVQAATYDCSLANFRFCNQPVTRTDANGNVANYTYGADHGGMLTATAPRPRPAHAATDPEQLRATLRLGLERRWRPCPGRDASLAAHHQQQLPYQRVYGHASAPCPPPATRC